MSLPRNSDRTVYFEYHGPAYAGPCCLESRSGGPTAQPLIDKRRERRF